MEEIISKKHALLSDLSDLWGEWLVPPALAVATIMAMFLPLRAATSSFELLPRCSTLAQYPCLLDLSDLSTR